MRESRTYQAVLAEGRAEGEAKGRAEGEAKGRAEGEARGRAEEARLLLLKFGTWQLGEPDRRVTATLGRISDPDRLEQLTDRLRYATSWDDVLADA